MKPVYASAGTTWGLPPKVLSRKPCRFGTNCRLRGDNDHIARFSHPRVPCRWGAACYRNNVFHKADFSHDTDEDDDDDDDEDDEYGYNQDSDEYDEFCDDSYDDDDDDEQWDDARLVPPCGRSYPPHWFHCENPNWFRKRVGMSRQFVRMIQQVIDKSMRSMMGRARDQRIGGEYTTLRVEKAWRLESSVLWGQYCCDTSTRLRTAPHHKQPLWEDAECWAPWMEGSELDPDLNELLLFHGTAAENCESLIESGFNERLASAGGLYGAGIYFSDSSSKADQYAMPDADGFFYIFVTRVALGNYFPIAEGVARNGMRHAPKKHDSVVGRFAPHNFREFVVYRGTQTYPEFLIKYRRE